MRSDGRPSELHSDGRLRASIAADRSLPLRTADHPRGLPPALTRWTIIAIVVLLWEVLPRIGAIPQLFLPPLSASVRILVTDWPTYASALLVTLREVCAALVLVCCGGILGGAVLGSVPALRALLLPVASSLYAVPIVIVYPILTVWFGIGPASKIAFATLGGFFPTLLATAAGIRTIDPNLLLAARSMGASLPQLVLRVIIPAAIPTILAGLRLGGVLAIVGVVVSEMLISDSGIGYLVTSYRTVLDSPHVFAAVLLIVLVTLLFDTLARWLEYRTGAWQPQSRSALRRTPRGAPDDVTAVT